MNNLTDNLRIASLNVKGITGYEKKIKVKNWVREKKVDVLCIQECHAVHGLSPNTGLSIGAVM